MFDVITTGLLYSITKSKISVIMNLAEFIPFVGDFLPVYTVSTLIWIIREYGYESLLRKLLAWISNKRKDLISKLEPVYAPRNHEVIGRTECRT